MKLKKLLIEVSSAFRIWLFLLFTLLFVLPSVIFAQDGTDFRIQTPSNILQDSPDVVYNKQNDEFFSIWRDYRNGWNELFGRRVSSSGSVQGNHVNISVVRDATNGCITHISSTNKYLAVYQRQIGGGSYDLWYQLINPNASLPANTWGQLTGFSYDATYPAIAYNSASNRSLLVWTHNIFKPSPIQGDGQIYGVRVDQNGHEKGSPFLISTSSGGQYFIGFATVCASPKSKNFLVCWYRLNKIYGQRIEITQDTLSSPLKGQNFSITQTSSAMRHPQIIYNSTDDEFLVIWEDNRKGYGEIFGRRVGSTSGLPSLAFSISGPSQYGGTDLYGESGAYSSKDNSYLICWKDWGLQDKDNTRGCYVNKNGTVLGNTFTINDAPIVEDKKGLNASYSSGVAYSPVKNKYLVTWVHNMTGYNHEIYGDIVDSYTTINENIIVDVPNGGESWEASHPQPIVWHTQNFTGNVKIELSTNGGSSWTTIANNVPTPTANTATSYNWTVSNTPSTQCRIRISDASDANPTDISNANFAITSNEAIILDVPNGGENWIAGVPMPIVWHTHIFTGNVKIELSTNGGSSWTTIANNVSTPTTSYTWTVSNTPSSNCFVKISDASTGNPSDVSDNKFTISGSGGNNTNTGNNVKVNMGSDVSATFDNVTGAGNTTLNKKTSGAPPPSGFQIAPTGSPVYYDINTTATFTGNIKICIKYDDTGMSAAQEASLKLQVYEVPPGSWKDITISKDATANIICGQVNHLTDFAVMIPTGGTSTQTISLPQGWNWISFNVQPTDLLIDNVFSGVSNLAIVVNNDGDFYMPGVVNSIGNLNILEGYKTYVTAADQVSVTGQQVNATTPISLNAGWNFVSYLPTTSKSVETALASILSQLAIVQNDNGNFFIPSVVNSIGNMEPDQGYKMYLNSAATLTFPSSLAAPKQSLNTPVAKKLRPSHFKFRSQTGEFYSVVVHSINISGVELQTGDEIGIFTKTGICVGAGVWNGSEVFGISCWQENDQTKLTDGYRNDEPMQFKFWDSNNNLEIPLKTNFSIGNGNFGDGAYAMVELRSEQNIVSDYTLEQNYPNPFNAQTKITYHLSKPEKVELKVFSLLGEEITSLVSERKTAGSHSVIWNGKNDLGNDVPSGIYLYQLNAGEKSTVKRAILIK